MTLALVIERSKQGKAGWWWRRVRSADSRRQRRRAVDSAVLRLEANGCDPDFVFLLALLGFHAVVRDGGAP